MHATVDDLLSVRDGAPTAPGVATHLAQCAECRATLAELGALRADLCTMPTLEPPRDAWARITARAEPPVGVHPAAARWRTAAAGLAASVALVAVLFMSGRGTPPAGEVVPSGAPRATIAELQRQSARLESMLAKLGGARVVSASTAGEIAALEDHIALVDWQLSGAMGALEDADARTLWERRVELMQDLVLVRAGSNRDDNSI